MANLEGVRSWSGCLGFPTLLSFWICLPLFFLTPAHGGGGGGGSCHCGDGCASPWRPWSGGQYGGQVYFAFGQVVRPLIHVSGSHRKLFLEDLGLCGLLLGSVEGYNSHHPVLRLSKIEFFLRLVNVVYASHENVSFLFGHTLPFHQVGWRQLLLPPALRSDGWCQPLPLGGVLRILGFVVAHSTIRGRCVACNSLF